MKKCGNFKCLQINPQSLNEFNKDSSRKDGLDPKCKSCRKQYRQTRKEGNRVYQINYYLKNKEWINERNNAYNALHKEEKSTYDAIYYMSHKMEIDARHAIYDIVYAEKYPEKLSAKASKRHAAKLKRTLKSLTEEHREQIQWFYSEAARLTRETGIPHEVDHILPLQGKTISGLHVPWNLQILTEKENNNKRNKFDFTYENESWTFNTKQFHDITIDQTSTEKKNENE